MRLVWLTDIHLNFLGPVQMDRFIAGVKSTRPDTVVISGDIGEAPRLIWFLKRLEAAFQRPTYFVLGNHDYYHSSFADVGAAVRQLVSESRWLRWLTDAGVVELAPGIGLIGHDSWADGRLGNFMNSPVELTDYVLIRELSFLSKSERLKRLNALGDQAAAYCREWLPRALAKYRRVFLVTHVPPFREACWHEGQISDDDFLPHFGCKAVGEALADVMSQHPDGQLTVLCGHTHGAGQAQILPNLLVLTGGAEYGKPDVQRVFEL